MKVTKEQIKKIISEEIDRYQQEVVNEAGGGRVYEIFEYLKDTMGAEELLDELYQAMSSQEAMENFEHIARMHDIRLPGEEEGEEEEEMVQEKAVSQAQQQAAGAALAAVKGDMPKAELKGASKEMAKMDQKELEKFASTKHEDLPKKKEK